MTITSRRPARWRRRAIAASGALILGASLMTATAASAGDDPRVDLPAGFDDAGIAASGVELLDSLPVPAGFVINSDLAFTGDKAIVGSFSGFQVFDISDPAAPALETAFVCPGGQGDVSVYGDLLFMSVEATNGRIDCGTAPITDPAAERFRGVRIFDISDLSNPVQLPGVQTCRGSHTHTVVTDPDDAANVYIYNSGTSSVRSALELEGCENAALTTDPVTEGDPTQWRIDVIKVPLAAPETAEIVSQPRIFTDVDTGAYNGLQNTLPGSAQHPSGSTYSPTPNTNTCHDVTAFPEIGLLAGACQGNGILVDISDPVNPVRIDAVADTNFSYWHSATFNNDGTKVVFTDEWGGGTGARCLETHQPEWGANALFDIVDGKLEFASYYKLPAPQTAQENCVAHNGSIIPVPGRDIMVQAWYQGGMSILDFTDTENPVEIAYLDRGPISDTALTLGGYWSTYWYNGNVLGSEIARGFDTMELVESDMMSANEIAAAGEIELAEFNAQLQSMLEHDPSFAVARSYVDQAERAGTLSGAQLDKVNKLIDKAESTKAGRSASGLLTAAASESGFPADSDLVQGLKALAASLR
ncbi:LVIVD repeat-containing protein [Agromyces sp. ZXT2-6]|uniref:LVIVD repeat-containing protein n=1 Tax=Agromyces sp. ZXT2-6 TaxID=3461153 RepID=UPI0040551C50